MLFELNNVSTAAAVVEAMHRIVIRDMQARLAADGRLLISCDVVPAGE